MPMIRPSADLRNNYNEISALCHQYREPIYITKNGRGDLAVMSIETYEQITGRQELYRLIEESMEDVRQGKGRPYKEVFTDLRKHLIELQEGRNV